MGIDDRSPTDSTFSDVARPGRPDRGMIARRITVAVFVVFHLVAAAGWLGVHSGTVRAERAGYRLSVTYPVVARAGLDVPLTIRYHSPQPITDEVQIGISADYFRIFETQGFFPEPSDMSSDGQTVWMTFSPPPAGRDLVVDYDAYIQPSSQRGRSATVRVRVDGIDRIDTAFHTSLMP